MHDIAVQDQLKQQDQTGLSNYPKLQQTIVELTRRRIGYNRHLDGRGCGRIRKCRKTLCQAKNAGLYAADTWREEVRVNQQF